MTDSLLFAVPILAALSSDWTPPVSAADLGRFPPPAVIEARLAWYAEHRDWVVGRINSRLSEGVWDNWTVWLNVEELDGRADAYRWLLAAWRARDCGDDPAPHLRKLVSFLAYDDYYAGRMPQLWLTQWVRPLPDPRDKLDPWP